MLSIGFFFIMLIIIYLIKNHKKISKEKIENFIEFDCDTKFKLSKKFRTRNFLEEKYKKEINEIIKLLFCDLRKKKKYNLSLLEYDSGSIIVDSDNNKRFIINIFIYDNDLRTSKKVELDLIKLNNNGVKLISIKNGKSFDSLEKIPESTRSNIIRNYDNSVSGVYTNSLEFTNLKDLKTFNPDIECDKKIQNIINSNRYLNFPCRKQLDNWDKNGVHYTENESKKCIGLNNTDNERINNTNNILLGNKGSKDYGWAFDLTRDISKSSLGSGSSGNN